MQPNTVNQDNINQQPKPNQSTNQKIEQQLPEIQPKQQQQQPQPYSQPEEPITEAVQLPPYYITLRDDLTSKIEAILTQIKSIQDNQIQLQLSSSLTPQTQSAAQTQTKSLISTLLPLESTLMLLAAISCNPNPSSISEPDLTQQLTQHSSTFVASQQQIEERYTELTQSPDDSNWTDASQSQADDEEIWVVDDDIIKAMEDEEDEDDDDDAHHEEKKDNGQDYESQKKDDINLDELEEQFVTGQESDHHILFGKHDKFCVSINCLPKKSLLVSGGGDDYLYMYNMPLLDGALEPTKCIHPFHMVKHTQTVSKIEISYSKQYIFTLTDNEVLCTEIKTKQTTALKSKNKSKESDMKMTKKEEIQVKKQTKKGKKQESSDEEEEEDEEPICSDMVCHNMGDVVALSSGFEVEIYNIKGLKLYQTYYCEQPVQSLQFTQTGKQLILNCTDNRLRLLTPKSSEFSLITGTKQHKSEISTIRTKGDIILSGCIDGYIGISSIKKSTLTTLIGVKEEEDVDGAISMIQFAGMYFVVGGVLEKVDWYDFTKAKRLFQSPVEGSPSDMVWQGASHQHLYNIGTIKGYIHLYDCRNPLKEIARTRAGNTIHKLWAEDNIVACACEDGAVRVYDVRKLL